MCEKISKCTHFKMKTLRYFWSREPIKQSRGVTSQKNGVQSHTNVETSQLHPWHQVPEYRNVILT
jgi:hypothetical protein